jgi:hypothetical protein
VVEAVHGDAEQAPDSRVGAVGADQIAGPDGPPLAGGPVPQLDGDAVGFLVEGDQLGAEADLGQPQCRQVAEQHRLPMVLGHGGEQGRAGRGSPLQVGMAERHQGAVGRGHRLGGPGPTAVRSSWPARTWSSRPQERSSSMVRVLTAVARGRGDRPGLRSTSSEAMPLPARVTAVTRPAGPAPTITTGTCRVGQRWPSRSSSSCAWRSRWTARIPEGSM